MQHFNVHRKELHEEQKKIVFINECAKSHERAIKVMMTMVEMPFYEKFPNHWKMVTHTRSRFAVASSLRVGGISRRRERRREKSVINYATLEGRKTRMVRGTWNCYFLAYFILNSFIHLWCCSPNNEEKNAYHCDYVNLLWK